MSNCNCGCSDHSTESPPTDEGVRKVHQTVIGTPDKAFQAVITSTIHSGVPVAYSALSRLGQHRFFTGMDLEDHRIRVAVDDASAFFVDDAFEMTRQREDLVKLSRAVANISEPLLEASKKYQHPFAQTPALVLGIAANLDLRDAIEDIRDERVTAYFNDTGWDAPDLFLDNCYEDGGYCSPEFRSCVKCNSHMDFGVPPDVSDTFCISSYNSAVRSCRERNRFCTRNCILGASLSVPPSSVRVPSMVELALGEDIDIEVPDPIGEGDPGDLILAVCLQSCQVSYTACIAGADIALQMCLDGPGVI